jgi:hypothetical protein
MLREREQLVVEKNDLELQLNRERRRAESVKREMTNLELEKESLIQ